MVTNDAGAQAIPDLSDESARRQAMAESGKNLNYIGEERLLAALAASVRHAVKRSFDDVAEEILKDVATAAEKGFVHLLKRTGKAVRGLQVNDFVREVEEARNRMLRQREQAQAEMDRLQSQMEQRQQELREERREFVDNKQRVGAALDERVVAELEELFETAGIPEELREQIREAALRGTQEERALAVQNKLDEHDDEVAAYELRIKKLTQSLARTEEEIKRLAAMKDADVGVASIYRTVQGLSGDDDGAETKKEMMAAIFEANLALQKN